MDLDFLILVVIYLGVILFIHYKLKSSEDIETKPILAETVVQEEITTPSEQEETININKVPKEIPGIDGGMKAESELIIKEAEIDNMSHQFNGDFMKYLEVEESNNNEVYRKLSDSIDINLEEKSGLDKYFKEHNGKYDFNEVPTLSQEYKKTGLLSDVKELNDQRFGNVYAFDEFNPSFSTI